MQRAVKGAEGVDGRGVEECRGMWMVWRGARVWRGAEECGGVLRGAEWCKAVQMGAEGRV